MEYEILDNDEVITCRICGKRSTRIYGAHLKSHGFTSERYKLEYPGAPLMAKKDLLSTNKNSGLHMKEDKYKKMFRDRIIGENNPNHRNKTTEKDRRSRSPFSKDFIKYKGLENKEETVSSFVKEALKDRLTTSQKEYWINKGFSEEDSILMVSERQRTFTLEKCIKKHGEEKGHEIWMERQRKWLTSYKKVNYSKISQEMFISLYNKLLDNGFDKKIFFAKLKKDEIHSTNKNYEFRLKLKKSYILPDFFIPELNLIIEFDGTYYHRDNIENKKREKERDENIINSGYKVIHIKESKYLENKDKVIIDLVNYIENYQTNA